VVAPPLRLKRAFSGVGPPDAALAAPEETHTMKLNRRNVRIAVVTAGLSLIPFAASAADTGMNRGMGNTEMGNKETKNALGQTDLEILAKLHEANLMEIEMGRMAKEQGKHKDVKGFGKDLIKDHEKADEKGNKLAKKHNVTIPNAMPADEAEKAKKEEHAQMMTKLRSLSGAEFDREFATGMVKGHQDTLMMIDQSMTSAESDDMRKLLDDVKPTIQRHLEKAQKLVEKVANDRQS
jgi:putative membrane protein